MNEVNSFIFKFSLQAVKRKVIDFFQIKLWMKKYNEDSKLLWDTKQMRVKYEESDQSHLQELSNMI